MNKLKEQIIKKYKNTELAVGDIDFIHNYDDIS